jgi:hypothetical protein
MTLIRHVLIFYNRIMNQKILGIALVFLFTSALIYNVHEVKSS